jgi:hypothetical protein
MNRKEVQTHNTDKDCDPSTWQSRTKDNTEIFFQVKIWP